MGGAQGGRVRVVKVPELIRLIRLDCKNARDNYYNYICSFSLSEKFFSEAQEPF